MTGPLGEHRLSSERIFFSYQYLFFFCYSRYHSRLSFAFRRSSGHSSQALACGCALLGHTAGTRSWVSDSRLLFYFKSESIARSGLPLECKKKYIYMRYIHICVPSSTKHTACGATLPCSWLYAHSIQIEEWDFTAGSGSGHSSQAHDACGCALLGHTTHGDGVGCQTHDYFKIEHHEPVLRISSLSSRCYANDYTTTRNRAFVHRLP